MFNKNQRNFLSISYTENRILSCVKDEPRNIFQIAKKIKIPRTTLYLSVKKLYERGFIKARLSGKRFVYKSRSLDEIREKIDEIF